MIFPAGAASKSVIIKVVDDSGLAVTGKVAGTMPTVYYKRAGAYARVAITLVDLSLITSSWTSGGFKEDGDGDYRLDVPDAMLANEGEYTISGETSGAHVICPPISVGHVPANVVQWNDLSTTSSLNDGLPVVSVKTVSSAFGGDEFQLNATADVDLDQINDIDAIPADVAALITPITFTKSPTAFTAPNFDVTLKHGTDYTSATGRLTSFTIAGIPTPTAIRWDFKQGRTVKYSLTGAFSAAGSGWLISCPVTRTQLDAIANGQYTHVFMATHSGGDEQEIAGGHVVVV